MGRIKDFGSVFKIKEWENIIPNEHYDWINQRCTNFDSFFPMELTQEKIGIFSLNSLGVITNRDFWVYNYDKEKLSKNIKKMIHFYNSEVRRYEKYGKYGKNKKDSSKLIDDFVDNDNKKIKWSNDLKQSLIRKKQYKYEGKFLVKSLYRPFTKKWLYYFKGLNERHYQTQKIFPIGKENIAICVSADRNNFLPLMCDMLPDIQCLPNNKMFPRYSYEEDRNQLKKIDNMNPTVINEFKKYYDDKKIDSDAVFYYIYALLHSKDYRNKYKNNLRMELPCIPFVSNFWDFSEIGKKLSDLHVYYEEVKKYPLKIAGVEKNNFKVDKMIFIDKNDTSKIIYNDNITINDIPEETYKYEVAGKSAIWWIMNRYQIPESKKNSGLENDPNNYSENPKYIIELLQRIVTVSVESVRLINKLPEIKEISYSKERIFKKEVESVESKLISTKKSKKRKKQLK
ncbi:MAG: hypothetical protein OXB84_03185 [Halobacteriovoraceae bacterium]|nr:hypothetical protein [Halobacteriovoraceae bacterium]